MARLAAYGRRIGNTFAVALHVRTTFLAGSLADHADGLALSLHNETKGRQVDVPLAVDGNVVSFTFAADLQIKAGGTGYYTPVLLLDAGGDDVAALDWWRAIEIVPHTAQEYSRPGEGVMVGPVSFSGEMSFLARGLLAYDAWLADGNTGSLSEYVAWMRQPAVEAAQAMQHFDSLTNIEIEQMLK